MGDSNEDGAIRDGVDAAIGATCSGLDPAGRDELFEALAHSRRRWLLAFLRSSDDWVPVSELGERIASAECRATDTVSAADRRAVETSLHHVHVPKLVDVGLVEWRDRDEREVLMATCGGKALPNAVEWWPRELTGPES